MSTPIKTRECYRGLLDMVLQFQPFQSYEIFRAFAVYRTVLPSISLNNPSGTITTTSKTIYLVCYLLNLNHYLFHVSFQLSSSSSSDIASCVSEFLQRSDPSHAQIGVHAKCCWLQTQFVLHDVLPLHVQTRS